jgi:hypothetical protein
LGPSASDFQFYDHFTETRTESKIVGACQRMEDNAMPKRMLKGRLYSKEEKEDLG